MKNIPQLKLGLISVSRDCFPISLSATRRHAVAESYKAKGKDIFECDITVENENDAMKALSDVKDAGCNAIVVYLGNFGPETSETIIAKYFDGPAMYVAAAEGDGDLHDGRGDAFCGVLNCSYNLGLRNIKAYIPSYPVGTADEVANMIVEFEPVATALIGISGLKIITFGPRPQDFIACNGPIGPLFELGVEIEENSELDLLVAYNKHKDDCRIPALVDEMTEEIGENNPYIGVIPRLAQYELTLLDWAEEHKGARKYVAFANKCWPAFQTEFGFVPCYVNSRMVANGYPVSCEVDIYGCLSEYIGLCVSGSPVTLLDINNTVPASIYNADIKCKYSCRQDETFMGFHCGNTCTSLLKNPHMGYQLIMKRALEPELEFPDITRGTCEGDIKPGDITFFRLQGTAKGELKAYIAQGEILDVPTQSFGSTGIFSIPEMNRFYRYVLIQKQYPHHGAVAFGHYGKVLFEVFRYLGIPDIAYNRPASLPYPEENPFAK
jgi:L-fucose isomerase-like protein